MRHTTPATLSGLLIVVLASVMAGLGIAFPSRADFPLIMFMEPALLLAIALLTGVVAVFNRRASVVLAFVSATPMWMLVGAAPAGVLGALAFFFAALLPGVAGAVAGTLLHRLKTELTH